MWEWRETLTHRHGIKYLRNRKTTKNILHNIYQYNVLYTYVILLVTIFTEDR